MAGLTASQMQQRADLVPDEMAAVENVILYDAEIAVDEDSGNNFEFARAGAYEEGDEVMSTVEITCLKSHPTHPVLSFKCDCGKATTNVETAAVNSITPCRHVMALFNEMDFDDLTY